MNPPKTTKVPKSRRSRPAVPEQKQKKFPCNVCDYECNSMMQLQYHIRGTHYNLNAGVPLATTKQVNDVWVEKVQNSDKLVEIRKTGPNTLVLKPMAPNANVKVSDHYLPDKTDLHSLYPTGPKKTPAKEVQCQICKKSFKDRELIKHMQEAHQNNDNPEVKHKCNNCNMTFNRSYIFLKHECTKEGNKNEELMVSLNLGRVLRSRMNE